MTRPSTLEVDHDTFTALAGLRGGAAAVSVLRAGQVTKRMLLLAAVRRTACDRAPWSAEEARLEHVYRLLTELQVRAPSVCAETVLHPYLDAWAARCLRALHANEGDQPDTGLVAELGYLAPLVAGAAARAGLHHLVPAALRPCPTDGLSCLRLDHQGLCLTVCVDDQDPLRGQYGRDLADPLSHGDRVAWRNRLDASWSLLTRHHHDVAEAIAACLTRVVPLRRTPGGLVVSSAARRAYGAVATSLPQAPEILALTLVHEFLHVQLGALLDLVPLHEVDGTARYRAGWHAEARPVGALLQGAYAHLGVCGFWHTRSRVATERARRERAARKFERHRGDTGDALRALLRGGQLTAAGEVFVGEMQRTLETW